jgi:UDP-2-acetamido-3-amino-2,3-dideoxy-glucuronate N-acetyltransferase
VTREVPDFALVAGVPAKRIGCIGRAAVTLMRDGDSRWCCAQTGERFSESGGLLAMTEVPDSDLGQRPAVDAPKTG